MEYVDISILDSFKPWFPLSIFPPTNPWAQKQLVLSHDLPIILLLHPVNVFLNVTYFPAFSKSFPFHRVAETGCLDTACIKAFMFCESTSLKPTMDPLGTATSVSIINGHTTGSDLLDVPIPYIRSMFQAYVRGYTPKIWPKNSTVPPFQDPGMTIDTIR
jgi:hypothetical protein